MSDPRVDRRRWWQTPPGHIPYTNRLGLGCLMGLGFGAAGAHVLDNPLGWLAAVLPLCLVALGIRQEWTEGY